jgi:hypothetical protein
MRSCAFNFTVSLRSGLDAVLFTGAAFFSDAVNRSPGRRLSPPEGGSVSAEGGLEVSRWRPGSGISLPALSPSSWGISSHLGQGGSPSFGKAGGLLGAIPLQVPSPGAIIAGPLEPMFLQGHALAQFYFGFSITFSFVRG